MSPHHARGVAALRHRRQRPQRLLGEGITQLAQHLTRARLLPVFEVVGVHKGVSGGMRVGLGSGVAGGREERHANRVLDSREVA